MSLYVSVDGKRATSVVLHVPFAGVWLADVELDDDSALSGSVEVKLGTSTWVGTVQRAYAGAFAMKTCARIAGGAGGWATLLRARHYHDDNGVRAALVVRDAAREAGETLGTATYAAETLGPDFVRRRGPAARVLEQVLGSAPWWVGSDGKTNVGPRSTSNLTAQYDLLTYDPRTHVATLAVDDPAVIGIGSVLRGRAELRISELEFVVSGGALRVHAWGGAP
jgi:hypothetical protein